LQALTTASANAIPKRKFNWLISPAVHVAPSAMRNTCFRSASGIRREACATNRTRNFGGVPFMSANATSIPSAEVPLINPITSIRVLVLVVAGF
jgi:hypothetical protein